MSYKGKFKPVNYKKYEGNPNDIVYRSLLELRLMKYCDHNENVISWSNENVVVPYKSPVDSKWHRYFVDFLVTVKQKDNSFETYLIEVKPESQTKPPVQPKDNRGKQRYLKEAATYAVNEAKWNAALKLCEKKGWKFKIMTEKTLGVGTS